MWVRVDSRLPEEKLLVFDAHVGEFSKVLIEGGHWYVFGRSARGNQAVHEMDLRFSIAVQCVATLLTGDEPAERRNNRSTGMLIERFEYKHALG
jgi:hypothetical protein